MMTPWQVVIQLSHKDGPFRIYNNPMRNDGVFIGQDKPIKSYPNIKTIVGGEIFPAVPQDAYVLPYQIPMDVAQQALKILNRPKPELNNGIWTKLTCLDCGEPIEDGEFANICMECYTKK